MASSRIRAIVEGKSNVNYEKDGESTNFSMETNKNNSNHKNHKKYQLCLKKVPKNLNASDIKHLCSNNGEIKVENVHISANIPYVFVSFSNLNDMKKILNKFERGTLGIDAAISRETERFLANKQSDGSVSSSSDLNASLTVDLETDSLSLERSKENKIDRKARNKDNDMLYCNGSVNDFANEELTFNGHCKVCKTRTSLVCERCGDFYCSSTCQRKDWNEHRYICFRIPNLVKASNNLISSFLQDEINLSKLIAKQESSISKECVEITSGTREKELRIKSEPINNVSLLKESAKDEIVLRDIKPRFTSTTTVEKQHLNSTPHQEETSKVRTISESGSTKSEKNNLSVRLDILNQISTENTTNRVGNDIIFADFPKSGTQVLITAIKNLNKVFIRSLEEKDKLEYLTALRAINDESKSMKTLNVLPKRGTLVVTNFEGSGYYRAIVLSAENSNSIEVAYVDFGNIEVKKLSDLKEIPKNAVTFKRYTFSVRIKDVPNDLKPSSEILNSFIDNEMIIIHNCSSDNNKDRQVDLIDPVTNVKMVDQIIKMQKGEESNISSNDRIFSHDIQMTIIPEGKNVSVYVFDNSMVGKGYVSIIKKDDVVLLEKFNETFQKYCFEEKTPYSPSLEEICLAKFDEDGIWYRAECYNKTDSDIFSVVFIDYGNTTNVGSKNIRKYPKNFTIYPCVTSFCLIDDLPDNLSPKAVERLKDLLPINTRCVVDEVLVVKNDGKEDNVARLPTIIKILQNESLI